MNDLTKKNQQECFNIDRLHEAIEVKVFKIVPMNYLFATTVLSTFFSYMLVLLQFDLESTLIKYDVMSL